MFDDDSTVFAGFVVRKVRVNTLLHNARSKKVKHYLQIRVQYAARPVNNVLITSEPRRETGIESAMCITLYNESVQ